MDTDAQIQKWSALKLADENQSPEETRLNRKERIWNLSRLNKARDEGRELEPGPTVWDEIRMRESQEQALREYNRMRREYEQTGNLGPRSDTDMQGLQDLSPEQIEFLKERLGQ